MHMHPSPMLERLGFRFETPEAGAPIPGLGGTGLMDSPVEPELEEPAAPPAWEGVSQDEWAQHQQELQYLREQTQTQQQLAAQLLGGQQPQQQQGPQRTEFDPWADNPSEAIRQMIREETAQYSQTVDQIRMAEANERAMDIIDDIASRDGEFLLPDSRDRTRVLAEAYVHQEAQRFGYLPDGAGGHVPHPRAAEAALQRAASEVRDWEQAVGKAYHERQMNQLQNLGGARPEPGAGPTGSSSFATGDYSDGNSVADRFFRANGQ